MNIFLIGASGMIGSRILNEAALRGHVVKAAARRPGRIMGGPKVEVVTLDATDGAAIAQSAKGAEVMISAVSPRSTGDPIAEMAAIGRSLVDAAKVTGARLIVVGTAGSLDLPEGAPVLPTLPEEMVPEARAMKRLLDTLVKSQLDWTYFAPPLEIKPGERTEKFRRGETILLTDKEGNSRISAEDFAVALMNEVENPTHHRQVFTAAYG